jgi:hypothetical protein
LHRERNTVITLGETKAVTTESIGYTCEDGTKVCDGANEEVLTLSSRKPRSSPPNKRTIQPGDAFEDTAFKPVFEIAKY